jgi:predicted TIM-barrel fold metal-dependent hydrolase
MYDGPIIDAHTHLWDLSMNKHAWLSPSGPAPDFPGIERLRRNHLVANYLADSANQNIVATVHIEASWDAADPIGETEWLETLDKSRGVAERYVASAPLGAPEAVGILERQAAHQRVVGVRDILSFHPTSPEKSFAARGDRASDPAWRRDVARLPGLGLHFELMMYPYQLDTVLDLAQSMPALQLVVNHCASPIDRDDEGLRRWRDAVKRLAAEPNIRLKISNAAIYDPEPTHESLRAVTLHCIDCFGPLRAIFATDWPVAGLKLGFDETYDFLRRITADMTKAEQRALFHDNAARLYRINDTP